MQSFHRARARSWTVEYRGVPGLGTTWGISGGVGRAVVPRAPEVWRGPRQAVQLEDIVRDVVGIREEIRHRATLRDEEPDDALDEQGLLSEALVEVVIKK